MCCKIIYQCQILTWGSEGFGQSRSNSVCKHLYRFIFTCRTLEIYHGLIHSLKRPVASCDVTGCGWLCADGVGRFRSPENVIFELQIRTKVMSLSFNTIITLRTEDTLRTDNNERVTDIPAGKSRRSVQVDLREVWKHLLKMHSADRFVRLLRPYLWFIERERKELFLPKRLVR